MTPPWRDVELHEFEHLIFLGTSLLYWWPVVYPLADRRRLGYGSAIVYLSAPMIEGSVIGAALTFASRPLYATYAAAPRVLDVSVLFDQQLGGLIMWIPGSLLYILPIMVLLIRLVQREEHPPGWSRARLSMRLSAASHQDASLYLSQPEPA